MNNYTKSITVNAKQLKGIAKNIANHKSYKEALASLNFTADGFIQATDCYNAYRYNAGFVIASGVSYNCKAFLDMRCKKHSNAIINFEENTLECEGIIHKLTIVDAEFPNIEKVIPKSTADSIMFSVDVIGRMIQQAKAQGSRYITMGFNAKETRQPIIISMSDLLDAKNCQKTTALIMPCKK